MTPWMMIGLLCMTAGILTMGYTFRIQQQEDTLRMPGYYTSAEIVQIEPNMTASDRSMVDVTFEFTKDFKVWHCKNSYPPEEAKHWAIGRRTLIVFDAQQERIYVNPMRRERKKQAWFLAAGSLLVLTGMMWTMTFYGFVPH